MHSVTWWPRLFGKVNVLVKLGSCRQLVGQVRSDRSEAVVGRVVVR